MRRQTNHFLALTVGIALLVLPGLAGHSELGAGGSASGMSAPATPRSLVDSSPAAKIFQSHFHWCGQILQPANFSLALLAVRAGYSTKQVVGTVAYNYGPLHRRPPPSFS
jgi:hypothetical protein